MSSSSITVVVIVATVVLIMTATPATTQFCTSNGSYIERPLDKLYRCLTDYYDSYSRPVTNLNDTIEVNINFISTIVSQMADKDNSMSIEAYVTFSWRDIQLTWDPAQYSGINSINLPFHKIWEPEIILYDNRPSTGLLVDSKQLTVSSDGMVQWTPQLRLEAYCTSDYKAFPYDEQVCRFMFLSQMYERNLVKMNVFGVGSPLSKGSCTSAHNEWEVDRCTPHLDVFHRSEMLSLVISVKRKYTYHVYVLIIPTVIIVFLILSIYWIPHYSNQRFSFAGGMLFVMLLMNFLVQEFLPIGLGNVPCVVSYTLYALLLLTITTILSLVTYYLYFTDPKIKPVPEILKTIFFRDIVSWITGVNADIYIQPDPIGNSFDNRSWANSKSTTSNNTPYIHDQNGTGSEVAGVTEKLLEEIHKNLDALTSGQKSRVMDNEWKQLSMIFDRLLFFVFLVINVLVTSITYGRSYTRTESELNTLDNFYYDYYYEDV